MRDRARGHPRPRNSGSHRRLDTFDDRGFDVDLDTGGGLGANNLLLLILDDWGIDASELYNISRPGVRLATCPTFAGSFIPRVS